MQKTLKGSFFRSKHAQVNSNVTTTVNTALEENEADDNEQLHDSMQKSPHSAQMQKSPHSAHDASQNSRDHDTCVVDGDAGEELETKQTTAQKLANFAFNSTQ